MEIHGAISYAVCIEIRIHPAAAAAIEPELPGLADEIVAAIQAEVPEYAGPLRGEFGRNIRVGVEEALRRFFAPAGEANAQGSQIYRALGRGEHGSGRSLDALQAAYRIGARVAWRRMSRAAAEAGVPVADQHELAEAIFAYIDELAAESVEGYADARAAEAGGLERRRGELVMLLVADPPAPAAAVKDAADSAGWRLPGRIAMAAVPPAAAGRVARRLSGDVLYASDADRGYVAIPEPGAVAPELTAASRRYRVPAGLGPTVPLHEAPRSWRWATLALGGTAPGTVSEAEGELAGLLLRASPDIARALEDQALAPLGHQTAASRARLEATLLSWLRHRGAQAAVAAELGVHPQTVRYRMRRVRDLFGAMIEDPDQRLALELALRSRLTAG